MADDWIENPEPPSQSPINKSQHYINKTIRNSNTWNKRRDDQDQMEDRGNFRNQGNYYNRPRDRNESDHHGRGGNEWRSRRNNSRDRNSGSRSRNNSSSRSRYDRGGMNNTQGRYSSGRQGGYNNATQSGFNTGSQFSARQDRYNNQDYDTDQQAGYDGASQSRDTIINIDSNKIGKLIGKGGSKIRELQEQSGAKITIDQSGGNYTSPVTLSGSSDAQQKAKNIIEDLMNDGYSGKPEEHNFEKSQKSAEETLTDFSNFDWKKALEEHDKYQQKKWSKLPQIRKNFYIEDPYIANMSLERVAEIRQQSNNIEASFIFDKEENEPDEKVPNPIETFDQAFHHYPEIMDEIRKQGFENPSPIQKQAWPVLLSGKDLIGIAQTGTGKTLAFLLPALIHTDGQEDPRSQRKGPNVLVMAPTRELALQIEKEVSKYSYRGIKAVCIYGGGNRKEQMSTVSNGVEIVIATPGRLNDLLQTGVLDVSAVTYLILDEADRMLDMGFEPQIRKTLLDVRPDRQTVMTSATWPQGVRRLAKSYMKNPVQITVGSLDLAAVHSVTQKIYIVSDEEKLDMMYDFFKNMGPDDKVIVFFGKKARVDDISSDLVLAGVNCQSIHGGREQCDREQALEDIKTGEVRILLATDVASRGIDIEDITHVFNYDFPRDIEEYVHRVGRTGRAGRTGESITLMTRGDWSHAKELIKILEEAEQEIPEELYKMSERYDIMKEKRAQEKTELRGMFGGDSGGSGRGGRSGGRRSSGNSGRSARW